MTTYHMRANIGPDRKLELVVPEDLANTHVDIALTPQGPAAEAVHPTKAERDAVIWRLAEGVDDPTFVRHPQGEYEKRLPFD